MYIETERKYNSARERRVARESLFMHLTSFTGY